ncbi:M1 family metallopeptidase [Aquimarina agarivorans]|uniref:M1 family metallopeptidase n=1 Tax=Aquimarina agarivorans TaxID=980584 RepID=UPI0002E55081|nr:M1 family aminopeptidase [Aquimarina agarivorans]
MLVLIQVLLKNKYIGYFVSILLLFVWDIAMFIMDIESNMLRIDGAPTIVISDMNAFGPALKSLLWFKGYWLLFSIICVLIAGLFWNRDKAESFKNRIKNAKKQLTPSFTYILLGIFATWIVVLGYIYYNTQIVNKYLTADQQEKLTVEYEKKYKKYEHINLPKIQKIHYFVDLFPYRRSFDAKAIATLANETNTAIDAIHFNTNSNFKTVINIPNAVLELNDSIMGYRIYKLNKALLPDEEIEIEVNTNYTAKGFKNNVDNSGVINNGTFLNNGSIFPGLGYAASAELSDKNLRKKYDLPPKDRMPALTSNCTDKCMSNYISNGRSDFIKIETTISTASDQIAIAPGSLTKKWNENDRTYFHYNLEQPSLNFVNFVSAKYKIKTRKWKGVDLEVYYDEKHEINTDMMLDAVARSLNYYTENFGPYMHKQCRIIEFPRYRSFAQAFPGTMPYSESIGFIINLEDENDNNVVDAVVAHEMAHQWWAHQVVGANMQGGTMLSEAFSEYASLMTMKSISKTAVKMREFVKYNHDRYLIGRGQELNKEQPLYKVENQQYIHYGKGSVLLYALQDYIGEDKVNTAMRNFLEEYRYKKPPYPTSLDFLRHLNPQVPDSLNYLVTDWIKKITLYDNRIKKASYKKQPNGKYKIVMTVESKKLIADTIGIEKEVKINDWVDLGAFSDMDEKNLIFEKRVKINQPKMDFSFEIDTIPAKLAIDPRRLLIDRVYKDNSKTAEEIL